MSKSVEKTLESANYTIRASLEAIQTYDRDADDRYWRRIDLFDQTGSEWALLPDDSRRRRD